MVEIVAAVQFEPVQRFGAREIIGIGQALQDWEALEVPPAIPPIVETATGSSDSEAWFGIGDAPRRIVLGKERGRWTAQVQHDRVAVHEAKTSDRPSFANVEPKLAKFASKVAPVMGLDVFKSPENADIVEVIYVNHISTAQGGWSGLHEMNKVLRILAPQAGEEPYARVEATDVSFSYRLPDAHGMAGRLRVLCSPEIDAEGNASLSLRVLSRRFVRNSDVVGSLRACHDDIVTAFTAITTPEMHRIWERFQ